jgi:Cupin-like domain/Chromo (CHRromatin Organisation MOdifier) domain
MPGSKNARGRKRQKTNGVGKVAKAAKTNAYKGVLIDHDEEGYPIFEVEKVVDARKNKKGEWEYKVRWKNYGPEGDTWQSEADIRAGNCADLWNEARRIQDEKDESLRLEVIDLFNELDSETEHDEKVGSKGVMDKLNNEVDDISFLNQYDAESASTENMKRRKVNRDVWHEQVKFREVQRINVHDIDARQRVTEARENGTPICLTGHNGWAQFAKRWLRLKSNPDTHSEATTVASQDISPTSQAKNPAIESLMVEKTPNFGVSDIDLGPGMSRQISLSDEPDNRSTTSLNPGIQDLYAAMQGSDTSTTECEDEWLDLTLDWEVDKKQMMGDIGMEKVPVLRKGYDEYNPIEREITCSNFLKNCWPSPGDRAKSVQRLYLHQWQFPLKEEAKSKLCGNKCHNPLPNNIFGEDLLSHDQLDRVNMLQYIFMGREETVSNMHRDLGGLDITIAPIVGEKEAIMVHRSDGVCISHLEAKLHKIDLHKHPLLPFARIYKTIVRPGEILLMPQGTYHGCRNVTPCLSYSRFILDNVNLRAFVESMWDRDAPEIGHEKVIWDAAADLIKDIDKYLENPAEKQKQSSINPATMEDPAEIIQMVEALCALRSICGAISLRIERGYAFTGGDYRLKDWYTLLKDTDCTLHDFNCRDLPSKPPFRFRGATSASGRVHKWPLEIALDKLPAVLESVDCIPQSHNLAIESRVEVRFHGRRVEGVVKRIELAKQTAFLCFDGFPSVYNEYQPFEALRAPVAGESCTEIPPGDVIPGKVVILPYNKEVCFCWSSVWSCDCLTCRLARLCILQQYKAVVESCTKEDLVLLKTEIGGTPYNRWMPRSAILNIVATSEL